MGGVFFLGGVGGTLCFTKILDLRLKCSKPIANAHKIVAGAPLFHLCLASQQVSAWNFHLRNRAATDESSLKPSTN